MNQYICSQCGAPAVGANEKLDRLEADLSASHQREQEMRRALEEAERFIGHDNQDDEWRDKVLAQVRRATGASDE